MKRALPFCLVALVACGDDHRSGPTDVAIDGGPDAARLDGGLDAHVVPDGDQMPDAGPEVCVREPLAADRDRFVVLAHPFVPDYEVLVLNSEGTLARTGTRFVMGKANEDPISFTADGEVGVVAQDDGTLGIFRLDAEGMVTVVEAAYEGEFYAARVLMDPGGSSAWVLDSQWRETGGGIYRIDLACDGRVVNEELVAPARLPYGMGFDDSGRAVVLAKNILSTTTLGPDVHLLNLEVDAVIASAEAFADEDWIGAGFAVGADHVFSGDNAGFSESPNSVAVTTVGFTSLEPAQTVEVEDPASIVISPYEDLVLVVSAFGDAIFQYGYDPEAAMPLTPAGEVAYASRGPALPTVADMVRRGALEGLVLVSENVAVRTLRFSEGAVTDLGPLELGESSEAIAGAVGIQP